MALVAQFPKDQKLCFVGDLIDRGMGSRQVVDFVIKNGHDCVTGNHEKMMANSKTQDFHLWTMNGGWETIASYNSTEHEDALDKHIEWMQTLPVYLEYKDIVNSAGQHLLVTHSSACKVWKWSEEKRQQQSQHFINNIIWGRPATITPIKNIYNVFGHTPIPKPRIKKTYANIDTGAVYSSHSEYGVMTALQFPEMIVYQQKNVERVKF